MEAIYRKFIEILQKIFSQILRYYWHDQNIFGPGEIHLGHKGQFSGVELCARAQRLKIYVGSLGLGTNRFRKFEVKQTDIYRDRALSKSELGTKWDFPCLGPRIWKSQTRLWVSEKVWDLFFIKTCI